MLFNKFKSTIAKYHLLQEGDKILVACSGGADSMALLSLFLELKKELHLELIVAHFNHQLRANASEDEQFVRETADRSDLALISRSRDVRAYARRRGLNLEEAARKLRYDFLKSAAAETGAAKIATGHTLTDQAETLLMRLFRGSGLQGLAGIAPCVDGVIIRPLIEIERPEIDAYLRKNRLTFCVDESNFDRRFLRNRIRLDLLPLLQKKFDPGIVPHLGRLAEIAREEDGIMEVIAQDLGQTAILRKAGLPYLDARSLSNLPRALARRLVRRFILELKGDLRSISFADVEALLGLGENKEWHFGTEFLLRREKGFIYLKEKTLTPRAFSLSWDGKKPLRLESSGFTIQGKKLSRAKAIPCDFDDNRRAFFDFSRLDFPLLVRSRKDGDRYRPLGAPGRKKLKEVMRAKGIPLSERKARPVFVSGRQIIWVPGCPAAEPFKVKKSTKFIYLIEIN
jgi:tRNA(Ile)-lysidine synthase